MAHNDPLGVLSQLTSDLAELSRALHQGADIRQQAGAGVTLDPNGLEEGLRIGNAIWRAVHGEPLPIDVVRQREGK